MIYTNKYEKKNEKKILLLIQKENKVIQIKKTQDKYYLPLL